MGEIQDKAKGKEKQVIGSITGDREKQSEGLVDETKGKAKGRFEELKQAVRRPPK